MTIAAAQGLTCDYTLVYGVGADANSLYPALSRDRIAAHLWLPADVVEDEETRRRLGEARSEQELLDRAVAAYADSLESDTGDRMVSDELAPAPHLQPAAPVPHQARPGHERAVDETEQSTAEDRAAARQARIDALREQLHNHGLPELTDEHKARLEELAARSASRAGQQPEPEPEFEAWQDRPYGHIGTQQLTSLIAEKTAQARRDEHLAADLTRQAQAKREALAAPVTPGQQRAREIAEILDRADHLAQTAAAERAAQQQAYNESRHAREVLRQLEEAKSKSRLTLRLAGTSRKETLELAAAYEERERAASRESLRAGRAAERAHREAWATIRSPETVSWFEQQGSRREAPGTVDELQNRLAAMRERLPDIERITNNGASRAAATAERQANEHRKEATRLTASAAALQEEKALRTRMGATAPTQHARETQERAAHIKQARQQAAEQAQNVQQARQEYRYEPPSQGRSGPSLGR